MDKLTDTYLPQGQVLRFSHGWLTLSETNTILHGLKQTFRELEAPRQLLTLFEGEHRKRAWISWPTPIFPKGKLLGSHMVGWHYPKHIVSHMVWNKHYENQSPPPGQLLPLFKGVHLKRAWTSWLTPIFPKGKPIRRGGGLSFNVGCMRRMLVCDNSLSP